MDNNDHTIMQTNAGDRLALIESSFARLAGEPLCRADETVWSAARVVVAHDVQDPPIFFYGNRLALDLFKMGAADFITLPSYKSAEPAHREERAAIFTRLEATNIVSDYQGIRIAADGTRFRIDNAIVWNLIDGAGQRHGQAATFSDWQPVEG